MMRSLLAKTHLIGLNRDSRRTEPEEDPSPLFAAANILMDVYVKSSL